MSIMTNHPGRKPAAWVGVVLTALTGAAMVAGAGAWLGWRAAGPLPTDAEARAVAAVVAPGLQVTGIERQDALFANSPDDPALVTWLVGGDEYDGGYVLLLAGAAVGPIGPALTRDGWQGTGLPSLFRKGDLYLSTFDDCGEPGCLQFERVRPAVVRPVSFAGWAVGLLLGGWAAMWLLGRTRRPDGSGSHDGTPGRDGSGAIVRALGIAGLVALLPATVAVTGMLFFGETLIAPDTETALWEPYVSFGLRPLVLAGVGCWLLTAGLGALGARTGEDPAVRS